MRFLALFCVQGLELLRTTRNFDTATGTDTVTRTDLVNIEN